MNERTTTTDPEADKAKPTLGERVMSEVRFFAGLLVFMFAFFTLAWGHYKIPSESMQPALEVGDHLYVSKFAYGYSRHSLPLNLHKLSFLPDGQVWSRLPKRGDVAVFRNPNSGLVMIKRVVGLPGDEIQITGGRLFLNGEMIERNPVEAFMYREHRGRVVGVDSYSEQLPDEAQSHIIYEQTDQGPLDNTDIFIVPENHVFFMGDNRDNSVDSRASAGPGFVPQDHLIGRADMMVFSFKRCKTEDGLKCPGRRFFRPL